MRVVGDYQLKAVLQVRIVPMNAHEVGQFGGQFLLQAGQSEFESYWKKYPHRNLSNFTASWADRPSIMKKANPPKNV